MKTPNFLDFIYGRSASLGRDVFQYVVTGTMFVVVSSVPWWSDIPWWWIREWNQITLLLVAAATLFAMGHVLLAIGFWIRNKIIDPHTSWDRLCNLVFVWFFCCHKHVDKYKCAAIRTQQALPGTLVVGGESKTDAHLGLEMSVLLKQPTLHAVFIERYNTLWHLRLGWRRRFSRQVSSIWPTSSAHSSWRSARGTSAFRRWLASSSG